MISASEVIVSRWPWPAQGRKDAFEILFEDFSDNPYCLHVGTEQVDRLPADSDRNKTFEMTVYTRIGLVKTMPCHYRKVNQIPYLKPWRKSH